MSWKRVMSLPYRVDFKNDKSHDVLMVLRRSEGDGRNRVWHDGWDVVRREYIDKIGLGWVNLHYFSGISSAYAKKKALAFAKVYMKKFPGGF